MYKFFVPCPDKVSTGRRSIDRENAARGLLPWRKRNRCVIVPSKVNILAEAIERRNNSWFVRTKVPSDLVVKIGDNSFHLHKVSMISRSASICKLILQSNNAGSDANVQVKIESFPGGSETFELVVKFCYGWKVELKSTNIAPLYCAANFLEMSEDIEQGNLIFKTEAFFNFIIFSSWKDIFRIFKSCETISPWARDLKILQRCSEAVAWKACITPEAIRLGSDDAQCLNALANDSKNLKWDKGLASWWFEDTSNLRIDHFMLVTESIRRKGMKSELIGSCIIHWTKKWLPRIAFGLDNLAPKDLSYRVQRITIESLVRIIPQEEDSVSCNFLLQLLKLALAIKIDAELIQLLERRVASMLERCHVADLLIKNHGEIDSTYDVTTIVRAVQAYLCHTPSNSPSRLLVVGRLIDGYLTLIAKDKNLSANTFQSLVETLPDTARYCNDNLYRAIDMYLKAHPNLTGEQRKDICRVMDYHKLSQEAREHVIKNDRLPLNVTTRFVLIEQVNMLRAVIASGSNSQRAKTQAIIRAAKSLNKGCMKSNKEIKMMKQEVEAIKMQLSKLQMCKLEIQKQLQGGIC